MKALVLISLFVAGSVSAQSALPPCAPNVAATSWTNCQGTWTDANGHKYSGEHRDGKPHGQSIMFSSDGMSFQEGCWRNNTFIPAECAPDHALGRSTVATSGDGQATLNSGSKQPTALAELSLTLDRKNAVS
jgi:hypothetical protein